MVDVQVGRVVDHGGSQVGHVVDVWQISVVDHSPTHRRVTATLLCGMGEEQLTQVGWRPGQPDSGGNPAWGRGLELHDL